MESKIIEFKRITRLTPGDFFMPVSYVSLEENLRNCLSKYFFKLDYQRYYIEAIMGEYVPDDEDKLQSYLETIRLPVLEHYFNKVLDNWGFAIGIDDFQDSFLFNQKFWEPFRIDSQLAIAIAHGVGIQRSQMTTKRISSIVDILRTHVRKINSMVPENCLNLNNGVIEVTNNKIIQKAHTKDLFFKYSLPYNYNKDEDCPMFKQYLETCLPDKECQAVIQEFFGWALIGKEEKVKHEKALFLIGKGGNGKSVLKDIMSAVFGVDNVSSFSLYELTRDSKADNNRYYAYNKLLNFASEIQKDDKINHAILKQLISCEDIVVKKMHSDTRNVKWKAKLVFSMNYLPTDVELGDAYARRLIAIPFEKSFIGGSADINLANKIIFHELGGILNWLIEGAKRLSKNGKFTECNKSKAILNEYFFDYDSIGLFLSDNGIQKGRLPIKGELIYRRYRKYCDNSNIKNTFSQQTFYKELKTRGFEKTGAHAATFLVEIKDGYNQGFFNEIGVPPGY